MRFRLKSTGYSSARYGACEVCGERCADVFIQSAADDDGCHAGTDFGHEECLIGARDELALNQVLRALELRTEPHRLARHKRIIDADGCQVFVGDASAVWSWLRATGRFGQESAA